MVAGVGAGVGCLLEGVGGGCIFRAGLLIGTWVLNEIFGIVVGI